MNTTQDNKWHALLNDRRRKDSDSVNTQVDSVKRTESAEPVLSELRTEIERDHDRILFCTPVRRMADKTQVFPLDRNDSVRNRLTHSHEVSNLARSLGVALVHRFDVANEVPNSARNIPALRFPLFFVYQRVGFMLPTCPSSAESASFAETCWATNI